MKTEIENFQSGFPECLESVKITMGHQTSTATNSPPGRAAGLQYRVRVHVQAVSSDYISDTFFHKSHEFIIMVCLSCYAHESCDHVGRLEWLAWCD